MSVQQAKALTPCAASVEPTRILTSAGAAPDLLFIPLSDLKRYVDHHPKLPRALTKQVDILKRVKLPVTNPCVTPPVANLFTIVDPGLVVLAAAITAVPLPIACALLCDESSGGENLWGGDARSQGGIFVDGIEGGVNYGRYVTHRAYEIFKRQRDTTGGEQGVGPTQLTLKVLQDAADEIGGAWQPFPNLLVGFAYLAMFLWRDPRATDIHEALNLYNHGHIVPSTHCDYGSLLLIYASAWAKVLNMPSDPRLWYA